MSGFFAATKVTPATLVRIGRLVNPREFSADLFDWGIGSRHSPYYADSTRVFSRTSRRQFGPQKLEKRTVTFPTISSLDNRERKATRRRGDNNGKRTTTSELPKTFDRVSSNNCSMWKNSKVS
jgi:hypothetical protein